jgi:orotidine-5'-phosphate decarboxylase
MNQPADSPVIIALDFETAEEAHALVLQLGPEANHFKVGLQLLTAAGPELIRDLVGAGNRVFVDLKLYEIPKSVAGGVQSVGKLGGTMVTVHASAGSAVLRAAVAAAKPFPNLRVLALTVITSLADDDLPELGLAPSVDTQVLRLASLAAEAGCHGILASAHEAEFLRRQLPEGTLIVCPGIKLPSSDPTDQVRSATPELASSAGATHIVVGRAVTSAPDPSAAFQSVMDGWNRGV